MPELLVGCPVLDRAWILPAWFDHVDQACDMAGVDPTYIFVGDPVTDPGTWAVIDQRAGARLAMPVVVAEPTLSPREDPHRWSDADYVRMAELRNELLGGVREVNPAWFLSLDSDVLLHPEAVVRMIDSIDHFDAVGGKTYLSRGSIDNVSYAMLNGGRLRRSEFHGTAAVDVIMAIKLMSPPAYAVDYVAHHQGEDVGWCVEARRHGLVLGFNGTVASKHVMDPDSLDLVDKRVGW